MRTITAASLALATVLGGCLSASEPLAGNALNLPVLGDPLVLEHDHNDPALHDFVTSNVQRLAHLAWEPTLLDRYPLQQWGELDVKGDTAYVAALWSGFAIVDVADPAAPKTLSYTPVQPAYVADIKATAEDDLVLLGLQGSVGGSVRALTGQALPVGVATPVRPGTVGVEAYDVSDPADPRPVGFFYVEGGCHMLSILEQDQGTMVYCAPNDNTIRVFRLVREGPAVVFEPVAIWAPGDLSEVLAYKAAPTGGQFTHDMTAQLDPLTGEPVMFVSFWDLGVFVVDVRDPANPALLGTWAGEDAELWGGKVHTTMATMVGDRRVIVTIPEYADIPAMFVLDATDYGALRLLGEWTAHPDGDYGESPALFSTHNFQVVGSTVYMAMYHGGVWTIDIRDPARPTPTSYYLPHEAPGVGAGTVGALAVPETWDVVVANGHVFALDIPTGLHILHVAGDPVDAAYDSFA